MEKFKQFLYKTKDFLDKYWKVIVICIATILLMGQCSSCNRDNRVERKDKEIAAISNQKDSIQTAYNHLYERFEDSQNHNNNFSSIAQGNQNALINKVDSLRSVIVEQNTMINNLQKDIKSLQSINNELDNLNNALRQDNIRLNAEVVDLMSKLNK